RPLRRTRCPTELCPSKRDPPARPRRALGGARSARHPRRTERQEVRRARHRRDNGISGILSPMREALRELIERHERAVYGRLAGLGVSSVIAALVESFSLALLFLLFKLVVSPELLDANRQLAAVRRLHGLTEPKDFILLFCGLLFAL